MRKLSLWAKHHVALARTIITLSNCLLIWIAYFFGNQLSAFGVEFSPLWIYAFMLIFFITCFIYPSKRSIHTYVKRKACDLVIVLCSFIMVICLVTQLNRPFTLYQNAQATVPVEAPLYKYPEAQKLLQQFKSGEKTTFTTQEKRIIKKEFKYQLGQYSKATISGDKEKKHSAIVIIFACIAAIGLLILLLALSCSISCGGADALAVIVAVLGTAAIIWGLVAFIHSVTREKRKS